MIQPNFINLHPNEYSQELHNCTFEFKLDRCVGSCNTLNDLSNKVCVSNKTEELNLSMLTMITGINESMILTKHLSCECKSKFDWIKCNSNQMWKNDKCWCECKNNQICEKVYTWNPPTCSCKNDKCLASVTDDSVVTCDKIIEKETKIFPTNFNEKR